MLFRSVLLALFVAATASVSQAQTTPQPGVPNLIFDTDMGPDYDDVGAITLLHALADSGQARILATVASTTYPRVGLVLNVFNAYFKRPNLPIGVPRDLPGQLPGIPDADRQHWSDTLVARYPHQLRGNEGAEEAVSLYRRVLATQPDGGVTVVTVGFFTNLANLLQSGPDKHSPLSGRELVARKVRLLVSMAGRFPAGREFNVFRDTKASQLVMATWPTPVLFSGFEIGEKIHTGLPLVRNPTIRRSPVQDVFRISIPLDKNDVNGRMSWDQTAVLVAVKGPGPYYTTQAGRMTVADDGSNGWDPAGTGHQRLVGAVPVLQVQEHINRLMQHQPRH